MDKRKTISFLLFGVGLMLLGAGLGIHLLKSDPPPVDDRSAAPRNCVEPAHVSFDAPELSLHGLDDQPVSLEKYRGQVVLLNAWATWCPPCLAELPDLEAFFKEYRDEGFVLVGVNIGEPRGTVLEFLEQNPLSFPIWMDPGEQTLRALNTIALPYSIVVDRTGEVRLAWSGATCYENLETAITPILRQ
ncbi:MAG: TlpA disulfide reductase family protein [Anaerolineales bacterium]|nr:TlpA disulfide reductase family protein [Anaerolineales bacterium]